MRPISHATVAHAANYNWNLNYNSSQYSVICWMRPVNIQHQWWSFTLMMKAYVLNVVFSFLFSNEFLILNLFFNFNTNAELEPKYSFPVFFSVRLSENVIDSTSSFFLLSIHYGVTNGHSNKVWAKHEKSIAAVQLPCPVIHRIDNYELCFKGFLHLHFTARLSISWKYALGLVTKLSL
jgi:hypothetical protein